MSHMKAALKPHDPTHDEFECFLAHHKEERMQSDLQSEQINELALALSKAQGEITGALKDSSNPFFKSKYADLASCWDACRKQLSSNGLAVIQTTAMHGDVLIVQTMLVHSSGQWVRGVLPVKTKDDGPQAQGSGITYARRYALAAMVGLAQIDDDAEAAQGRNKPSKSAAVTAQINAINSLEELSALFKKSPDDVRLAHADDFGARKRALQEASRGTAQS